MLREQQINRDDQETNRADQQGTLTDTAWCDKETTGGSQRVLVGSRESINSVQQPMPWYVKIRDRSLKSLRERSQIRLAGG